MHWGIGTGRPPGFPEHQLCTQEVRELSECASKFAIASAEMLAEDRWTEVSANCVAQSRTIMKAL